MTTEKRFVDGAMFTTVNGQEILLELRQRKHRKKGEDKYAIILHADMCVHLNRKDMVRLSRHILDSMDLLDQD